MKKCLLLPALILIALASSAQKPNTVINCYISNGKVNYGKLDQLLPDSMQSTLLVDPRKQFNMRDGNNILLWLEQQGWKMIGVSSEATGLSGTVATTTTYILAKEIYLDDADHAVFMQKLQTLK